LRFRVFGIVPGDPSLTLRVVMDSCISQSFNPFGWRNTQLQNLTDVSQSRCRNNL
jgi:hypothetical protein